MLGDTIKKMAKESVDRGMPADFVFGIVTAVSPVVVRIDERFDIYEEYGQIIIPKEFRPMQKVGEKIVLFRKAGGQSYLVMGRM